MLSEWKIGRLQPSIYLNTPFRESTEFDELFFASIWKGLTTYPVLREPLEEALFDSDLNRVKNWKRQQYVKIFFGKGSNHSGIRRYTLQAGVLGWNAFWMVEDAVADGVLDEEDYSGYLKYIKDKNSGKTSLFLEKVVRFAIASSSEEELISIARSPQEAVWDWLVDFCYFYANSYFLTPYEGGIRENRFFKYAKEALNSYQDLKVKPTSEVNDIKYMVDFVILTSEGKVVAGVSVKSRGYFKSRRNSKYTHVKSGEERESRGHKRFSNDYRAPVWVLEEPSSFNRFEYEDLFKSVKANR